VATGGVTRRRARQARILNLDALRCSCSLCVKLDRKERWGEAWQMSLLPLMATPAIAGAQP